MTKPNPHLVESSERSKFETRSYRGLHFLLILLEEQSEQSVPALLRVIGEEARGDALDLRWLS